MKKLSDLRGMSFLSAVREILHVYLDLLMKVKALKISRVGAYLAAPAPILILFRLVVKSPTLKYFRKFVPWHCIMENGDSVTVVPQTCSRVFFFILAPGGLQSSETFKFV